MFTVLRRLLMIAAVTAVSLLGCASPETGYELPDAGAGKGGNAGSSGNSACTSYETISDENLIFYLHELAQTAYRPIEVQPDQGGTPNRYTTARLLMFTEVERRRGQRNEMVVECLYTGETATQPASSDPDRDQMGCEHLRPRSRLYEDRDHVLFSHQESDIHHLFPVVPNAGQIRGELPFGEVVGERDMSVAPSYRGTDRVGTEVFEVRRERMGDVARAMFYMSVRWGLELSPAQDSVLRRWHDLDPVSETERLRNTAIQRVQGNRNPFVDCPALVDRIREFTAFRPYDLNGFLPNP